MAKEFNFQKLYDDIMEIAGNDPDCRYAECRGGPLDGSVRSESLTSNGVPGWFEYQHSSGNGSRHLYRLINGYWWYRGTGS